jgi:putative ABC transport system permease protein
MIVLGAGIAGVTAAYSTARAVLLKPLSFEDPSRLVILQETNPVSGWVRAPVRDANYVDWQQTAKSFKMMEAFSIWRPTLVLADTPVRLEGARVTPNMFALLGARPLLGPGFHIGPNFAAEDRRQVLIGEQLWERLGGDPAILGKDLLLQELNGEQNLYKVAGIMPASFRFPHPLEQRRAEIWSPLLINPAAANRRGHYLNVVARLSSGILLAHARAEIDSIAARLAEAYPDTNRDWRVHISTLHEAVSGEYRRGILLILGAAFLLFLLACANAANLVLIRTLKREKELAIRVSLGATRPQLVKTLLAETVWLAGLGGLLGLGVAYTAVKLLLHSGQLHIRRLEEASLDVNALAVTSGLIVLAMAVVTAAPAALLRELNVNETLKEGGQSSRGSRVGKRLRDSLVVGEIALAFLLVIGCTLLIVSYANLAAVPPGYDTSDVVAAFIALPGERYGPHHLRRAFWYSLLEEVSASPAIASVAATTSLPSENVWQVNCRVVGAPSRIGDEETTVAVRTVAGDYFGLLRIPLRAGRLFSEADRSPGAQRVAVVNETWVRRFLTGEETVGTRLVIQSEGTEPFEVVGVVGDVRRFGFDNLPQPEVYIVSPRGFPAPMWLLVKTDRNVRDAVTIMRKSMNKLDPGLPFERMTTLDEIRTNALDEPRAHLSVIGLFAIVGMLLALVGIYSVVSLSVNQRTNEIGIRMALGASRSDVLRMVLGHGLRLTLAGIGIGMAGAYWLSSLLSGLLYGVQPNDPLLMLIAAALLATIAVLAAYVPARRATRVDPVIALRYE